jgi:virginiamycin B lyase
MGRRNMMPILFASAYLLGTSLLNQGCATGRGAIPATPFSDISNPEARQTPPIGPTPPPNGNFMVEYPLPTAMAQPRSIKHCGFDLCVTEFKASKVDILTTTGQFSEYLTPTSGSGPFAISQAADKNFWFTEAIANKIGRLTPSGHITEFPIPTAASRPTAIWNGDASTRLVWFTESVAGKIASINIDTGSIVEYQIPTPDSDPVSIAQDKDGSMWFVERKANKIGTISPTGVITEFNIPTKNSGANDITFVEDGNVWFTESLAGKIARVRVPRGSITEYVVPYANSRPSDITEGDTVNHGYDGKGDPYKHDADDQVWFTDSGANVVSGYNYDLQVFDAPIQIPTSAAGSGAVSYGADNNIWFVEESSDKIGVYHLPTPSPIVARP